MGTREKKQGDAGNPGTRGLVPGDGLLLIGEEGGTFRISSDAGGNFFSTQTAQLTKGTPLIVVEGDPGTIGVVAVDHTGRRVIVTHVDMLVGIVVALSRGGKQTGET